MSSLPVKVTKEYGKFKSILGNRVIFPSHVTRMAYAIKQKNLLEYQPILVNAAMYVIDGQHRLAAAKRLKIEIPYIVVPDTDLEDVRMLNSHLKSWSARDFADSYAKTGNKHYKELLAFIKKYEVHLMLAASILSGHTDTGGGALIGTYSQWNLRNQRSKWCRRTHGTITGITSLYRRRCVAKQTFHQSPHLLLRKGSETSPIDC